MHLMHIKRGKHHSLSWVTYAVGEKLSPSSLIQPLKYLVQSPNFLGLGRFTAGSRESKTKFMK